MDPDGHATQDAAAEDEASISARMLRKRTKTGCLTCRKRRIKCGEERPVCKNCVKSKRHCEGYNQRVTFRPQTVDIRHLQNGATTFVFPAATMGMDLAPQESHYQAEQYQNTGPIRPRAAPLNITAIYPHYPTPYTAPPYQLPWHGGHPLENPNMRRPVMHQVLADQVAQGAMSTHAHSSALQPFPSSDAMPQAPAAFSLPPQPFGMEAASQAANMPATHGFAPDGTWHQQQHGQIRQASVSTANSIPSVRASSILSTPSVMTGSALPPTPRTAPLLPNSWSAAAFQQLGSFSNPQPFISQDGLTEDSPEQVYRVEHVSPHTILEQAAIEYQDDNYYDVDPEPLTDLTLSPMIKEEVVLEHIMKVGNLRLSQAPRVDGYSEGILDSYRPEQTANPLRNPATTRVFSHFIQVTAITISAYTRKPLPIGTYKSRADVPFSEAGIWTHTMPMAALHDQGLLQAMLALSSLHIAKLTGASTTPSYKHYAYALKAVHHNVGNASKRHTVPTIAASVLLAVYELWCAEHVKWSSHLAGARQLLVETDFAGMHRFVRKLKTEKLVEKAKGYPTFKAAQAQGHLPQFLKTRARQYRDLERIPDIDAQVVSLLAGKVVNYDDFGRVLGDEGEVSEKHANLDIPRFEILKDLFWGYVKHDMIGSVVSGNPMLLNFSRWTDCPPRAPINAGPGIIYGAYDHLIMLCGRIADFSTRDRARKLRGMQLNGGSWRPPPGAFGPTGGSPSNASGSRSPQAVGNTPSPQLPPYFGMAPPGPAASMPSQYWTTQLNPSPLLPEQEQMLDFATATQQAISEWDEIMRAVDAFVSMLGEYYQPQEPGHQTPPMTPFGPVITYKSLDVGCFWGYINFAYILAHRSHPYMPPYSHMAAAIAARTTQIYADMIGRIAAGVMPPLHGKPISPFVGAAMCDLCLPLFFTGVQLVHPQQRDWVITTLFDIERRCAYDTAGTIAHGCQTAWYKAGKAGRGPPYTHRYQTKAQDQRINGAWEKIDPRSEPDQADDTDRRFVQTKPTARLHWAMGILGEEEDK